MMTKKDLLENKAFMEVPDDAPIFSEIDGVPLLLTYVYYDSVNNEIHIELC